MDFSYQLYSARNEKSLEGVDHVKAWLTTICMNTFRDRYRKTVRRSQHVMERFGYRRLMSEMSALYYQLLHQKRNPNVFLQKEVA